MFVRQLRSVHAIRRAFSSQAGPVGFIGLGNMGSHMAFNLVKAGLEVHGYDVNQHAVTALEQAGGHGAASPKALAEKCTTIITMLPSPALVKHVYTDPETGLLPHLGQAGPLLIDSSTIDPGTAQEVAALASAAGAAMVDAPVSGGVGGAEQATLTFMVGGEEAAFERAKTVLESMGKNVVHCGAAGTGQVAKVCNNLVLGISMAAVSEGMNLGVKLGMDPRLLANVMNTSSGRCWSSDTYNPCPGVLEGVPASKHWEGGFGVDLLRKDLGLAQMAAKQAGCALPMGDTTLAMYDKLSTDGAGKRDFGVIYDYYAKDNIEK